MTILNEQVDGATGTTDGTGFEVRAIDPAVASQLRTLDDSGHAPRYLIDEAGGSPLRCCLRPSRPGEATALVSYAPLRRWALQNAVQPGPYDEVGPVFIHAQECEGPQGSEYPAEFIGWTRVFRAYRSDGTILDGRLATAEELSDRAAAGRLLNEMFDDPAVAVIHARAVEFGCFTFEIRRRART